MTVIVVANPKGGVGKSTLATNLAGYFAANGEWVALADLDKQQSAHAWLDLRPDTLADDRRLGSGHRRAVEAAEGSGTRRRRHAGRVHGNRLGSRWIWRTR